MDTIDRTPLTLAQTVSWIAWGRPMPRATFQQAFQTVLENHSSEAAAALAEMQAAAGGVHYDVSLEDQLAVAEAALFEAIVAGRLTCYGKADEREEDWQPVPTDWFWTDDAKPNAKLAPVHRSRCLIWIG